MGEGRRVFAYVGSFTSERRKARGDGINVYRVDPASGAFRHIQRIPDLVNPSFLALDRPQRHLYSVHADLDEVTAFRVDADSGELTLINRRSVGGKNPVHLAIDRTGRWLITANYAAGTVTTVAIEPDGSLGRVGDTLELPGEPGPHRKEQPSSHPHHSPFDPSLRFVLVPDKGLDQTFVLRLDPATGKLALNDPPAARSRSGAGPRHVTFHPTMRLAYVLNELDSTVTAYAWEGERGVLEPRQVVPMLPTSFTGDSTGAEIEVAPSGRFVYASNRGHDSIVVFSVDAASGLLTPVQWAPTRGKKPRFFTLGPGGTFLYAANEESDTIVVFQVDPEGGTLAPTGQVIENKSPACIVFAGG
jgi:6-phosphogluconolactonase (cycloisomerase 2 family)